MTGGQRAQGQGEWRRASRRAVLHDAAAGMRNAPEPRRVERRSKLRISYQRKSVGKMTGWSGSVALRVADAGVPQVQCSGLHDGPRAARGAFSHAASTGAISGPGLVAVPVMLVREVRVRVGQRLVPMAMAVRYRGVTARVGMSVVLVVLVFVLVFDDLRRMGVCVPLAQVQPNAQAHQHTGLQQGGRDGFAQPDHREGGTEERRHREVRSRPCRAEVPQGHDEQGQAD